jgi:hypothetical protein
VGARHRRAGTRGRTPPSGREGGHRRRDAWEGHRDAREGVAVEIQARAPPDSEVRRRRGWEVGCRRRVRALFCVGVPMVKSLDGFFFGLGATCVAEIESI